MRIPRYGLPAYDRDGLITLVAAILVVGRDLVWWATTLHRFGGFPQLVPEEIVDEVLNLIVIPMQRNGHGFLRGLYPETYDVGSAFLTALCPETRLTG